MPSPRHCTSAPRLHEGQLEEVHDAIKAKWQERLQNLMQETQLKHNEVEEKSAVRYQRVEEAQQQVEDRLHQLEMEAEQRYEEGRREGKHQAEQQWQDEVLQAQQRAAEADMQREADNSRHRRVSVWLCECMAVDVHGSGHHVIPCYELRL